MRKISGLDYHLMRNYLTAGQKLKQKPNIYLRQELERFVDIANAVQRF